MVSKNPPSGRDYKKEAQFEDTPERVKQREERNKARRDAERSGKSVAGKDVAHIVALKNRGSSSDANTRVESVAQNRSWRKGQRGYTVPNEGRKR